MINKQNKPVYWPVQMELLFENIISGQHILFYLGYE